MSEDVMLKSVYDQNTDGIVDFVPSHDHPVGPHQHDGSDILSGTITGEQISTNAEVVVDSISADEGSFGQLATTLVTVAPAQTMLFGTGNPSGSDWCGLQIHAPGEGMGSVFLGKGSFVNATDVGFLVTSDGLMIVNGKPSGHLATYKVSCSEIAAQQMWSPDSGILSIKGGDIRMPDLPTNDPAVAGQLWRDASADNVVKVSQG